MKPGGETKVGKLDMAVFVDKDVVGFDVATMGNPVSTRCVQSEIRNFSYR
jgi:hypothetical protein